jgi:hypothetical protein
LLPSRLSHLSYCQPSHRNLDFGFDVEKAIHLNTAVAPRSWELGTIAEAVIELRNPELTVFANDPFHGGRMQSWRNARCLSKPETPLVGPGALITHYVTNVAVSRFLATSPPSPIR